MDGVRRMAFFATAISFLLLLLFVKDSVQDDDELRLVKDLLFSGYDKNVRPVKDKVAPVEVKFGIAYTQIVDLDEKEQTFTSNVWVRMTWRSNLLRWNPTEYGNITTINIDPVHIWTPDIVLHNNADKKLPSGALYVFKTKVILYSNGINQWYAPVIFDSGCSVDMFYFPFDDQFCQLKFGSWTYNGFQVNIYNDSHSADLASYMPSSEFKLVSAKAKRNVVKYSCCPEPYPDVTYTLHLRRIPGFFLFNVIIPCLVVTGLAILTFLLPHEIGERVTLAIEAFLAMSVVVMMVNDSIPVNSDNTPLIVKILLISMFEVGGCLVCNAITLSFYRKTELPQWMRVVFLHYLAHLLFISSAPDENSPEQPKKAEASPLLHENKDGEIITMQNIHKQYNDEAEVQLLSQEARATNYFYEKMAEDIDVMVDKEMVEEDATYSKDFWRFASRVVDRIFLIIFIGMCVASNFIIFLKVPDAYGLFGKVPPAGSSAFEAP